MADTKTITQRYVAAWGDIKNPPLDGVNPHFKSRYATLGATLEAIREACKPQGIAYVQKLVRLEDGKRAFRSSIITDTGEVMELSEFPVETPNNPQAFGSNLTYCRRYQAQADFFIVGDEDDDGEAAANSAKRPASGQPFSARCRNCGVAYQFQSEEQMRSVQCCLNPEYEVI